MTKPIAKLLALVCAFAALVAITPPAAAQDVTVTSSGETVVIEGDTVRVEGAGGVTVVEGDWRRPAGVRVETDTEQILVELGAVVVEDRIRLDLAGDILFDFDSTAIRPAAALQLAEVAQVIRDRSVGNVHVIGHTDSVGGAAYNQKLSQDRAAAVIAWLDRNQGIPAGILIGSGMGATRPVAHNTRADGSDYPEGRARNRRVEIQMATREGVQIGPQVIIVPGGVRISESGISVGGGVEVEPDGISVGGAVEVDPSGISVGGAGGVRVDPGGVSVGGVRVDAGGVSVASGGADSSQATGARVVYEEHPSVCGSGDDCAFACRDGDCVMRCDAGATCDFSCDGGDCIMTGRSGATADFSCAGGDCAMSCEPGAECDFSCSGGDCRFSCPAGAGCNRVSCSGDDCVCTGPAC